MPADFFAACVEVRSALEAWASSPEVREAFGNDRRKFIAMRLAPVWPPKADAPAATGQPDTNSKDPT